jgi:hypothetical protein
LERRRKITDVLMKRCLTFWTLASFVICCQLAIAEPVPTPNQGTKTEEKGADRPELPWVTTPTAPPTPPSTVALGAPTAQFSSDPGTVRSWFLDGTAAIFGLLAVFFAILAVVITIVGIITGISKYRDLVKRLESELRDKVDEEFGKQLDSVVQRQIEPKVKEIIEIELKMTLETGKERVAAELSRIVDEADLKQALIDAVADEIRKRLSIPQTPKVEPKEFDQ